MGSGAKPGMKEMGNGNEEMEMKKWKWGNGETWEIEARPGECAMNGRRYGQGSQEARRRLHKNKCGRHWQHRHATANTEQMLVAK